MSDLTDLQAAGTTKIIGSDSTGLEQAAVQSTSSGGLHTNLRDATGTELGTATTPIVVAGPSASASALSGKPVRIGYSDGTNVRDAISDTTGRGVIVGAGTAGTPTGGVLSIQGVSGGISIPISVIDIVPSNGTITALDTGTSSLSGANGQVFYIGSPTASSAAVFSLSSIENVLVQSNILGTGGTQVVEVSADGGSFWFRPNVYQISTQFYTNNFTAPFVAIVNTTGMTNIRVRSTSSWSGTATIIVKESINSRNITIGDSLPSGTNILGAVKITDGTTNTNVTSAGALQVNFRDSSGTEGGTQSNPLSITPVFKSSSSTIATNGNLIAIGNLQNYAGCIVEISGTWVGTVLFTGSNDGTNYLPIDAISLGNSGSSPSSTQNSVGLYYVPGGISNLIVAMTSYVSGTAICNATYTNVPLQLIQQDLLNNGGVEGFITVSTTAIAVRVGASNLIRRKVLTAMNNGTATIYWGYTSSVTSSTGTLFMRNQYGEWDAGPNTTIFMISASGSHNVRVTEGA